MHELVAALRRDADRVRIDWRHAAELLAGWSQQAGAPARLATYLRGLPGPERVAVAARSRETATHYAWCLADDPAEPWSVWVNEYKDPGRWPRTYANSVHNHRYDFCTRILAGGYRHEVWDARWVPADGRLTAVRLRHRQDAGQGTVLVVPAESFHRLPTARAGTMTLLVKMRARFGYSISYDPATRTTQVHIPIEARLDHLIDALDSE
jgi:hypothetical protein